MGPEPAESTDAIEVENELLVFGESEAEVWEYIESGDKENVSGVWTPSQEDSNTADLHPGSFSPHQTSAVTSSNILDIRIRNLGKQAEAEVMTSITGNFLHVGDGRG